jgi:hypothetical protein
MSVASCQRRETRDTGNIVRVRPTGHLDSGSAADVVPRLGYVTATEANWFLTR